MENLMTTTTENTNIDMLLANSQNGIIEAIKAIENQNRRRDERINDLETETNRTKASIESLEKNTNVLCAPFHSKRRKNFRNLCKSRVHQLFDNAKDTAEYILFAHFLFKKIYGDIAYRFDLDTWGDINMENYQNETSMYSQAKEFAEYWTPSTQYIKECLNQMITKRDNGLLSSERCRALTEYLRNTDNGAINPFC